LETAEGNGDGVVNFLPSLGDSVFSSFETVSSTATLSFVGSVEEGFVGTELVGAELSFFFSSENDENLVSKGIFIPGVSTTDVLTPDVMNDCGGFFLSSSVGEAALVAEVFVVVNVLLWLNDDRDEYENSGLAVVIVLEISVMFFGDTSSYFFEVDDLVLPNDGVEEVGLVELKFVGFEVEGTPKPEAVRFGVVDAVVVILLVAANLATLDGGNGEPEMFDLVVEGTPNEEVGVAEADVTLLLVVVIFDSGKDAVPSLGGPLKSATGLAGDDVVVVVLVTFGFVPHGLVDVLVGGTLKELFGLEKLLEVELEPNGLPEVLGGTPNVLDGFVKLFGEAALDSNGLPELLGGTPNAFDDFVKLLGEAALDSNGLPERLGGTPNVLDGCVKLFGEAALDSNGLPELLGGTPNAVDDFVKLLGEAALDSNGLPELLGGTPNVFGVFVKLLDEAALDSNGLPELFSLAVNVLVNLVKLLDSEEGNGLLVVFGGTPNVLVFGLAESLSSFDATEAYGLLVVLGGTLNG
jgi:hypothetical protein